MESIYAPVNGEPQIYLKQFIIMPELWERFKCDDIPEADFSKWGRAKMLNEDGEFSGDLNNISNEYGGIYIYSIVPNIINGCGSYIMYVGMASKTPNENLRARVKSYRSQLADDYDRDRIHDLFTKWGKYIFVHYLPINADKDTIEALEDRLIACFVPPCNADIRDAVVKRKVKAFGSF